MEALRLGPHRGLLHRPEAERLVVLLPGARYPTRAPLLWFAREVALARGLGVLELLDELPEGEADPFAWARGAARHALDGAGERATAVVGKSLGTVGAELAAERALPSVWLTPVLDRGPVPAALAAATAPALLVGGSADPMWVPTALVENDALELLELDGLDHALQRPGDPGASLEALRRVTSAIDQFLARL